MIKHGVNATLTIAERAKWYELATQSVLLARLKKNGLKELVLVGKAGDRGVDLAGRWKGMDFVVQCKSSPTKATPLLWRELGGVHSQQASQSPFPSLVALVSPQPMTKAAHAEFTGSTLPFMHFILPLMGEQAMLSGPNPIVPPLSAIHVNEAAKTLFRSQDIPIPRVRSKL